MKILAVLGLAWGIAAPQEKAPEEQVYKKTEQGELKVFLFTAEGQPHGFFNKSPWTERTLHRVDEFLASLGYLQGKPTIELPKDGK